ncbi:MAG: type I methionyl aminopeptidase [Planctomycetota bacterium]
MRAAGKLAAQTLRYAIDLVKPGVTTGQIDKKVEAYIRKHDAIPAPLGYGEAPGRPPFPRSICTSINEVICHGIPGKQELKEGDIICIDVTVILDGFHGDTCCTVPVGAVSENATKLMRVTLDCLRKGIAAAKGGNHLVDVGDAIQTYAEGLGYGVVQDFVGHGLGRKFHEPPQVSHVARPRGRERSKPENPKLIKGMTFTIEPMINEGTWEQVTLGDGWTAITKDRKLSAQYEHSILINKFGEAPEILTLLPGADTDAPAGFQP